MRRRHQCENQPSNKRLSRSDGDGDGCMMVVWYDVRSVCTRKLAASAKKIFFSA